MALPCWCGALLAILRTNTSFMLPCSSSSITTASTSSTTRTYMTGYSKHCALSHRRKLLRAIVDALGMNPFFFQVYGGNSFETKKPDPFGARMLLREANVEPSETVLIGDSDVDVLTAQNAGLYSVGCTYGLAPHTLEAAPPDVLVDSPYEWTELFTGKKLVKVLQ